MSQLERKKRRTHWTVCEGTFSLLNKQQFQFHIDKSVARWRRLFLHSSHSHASLHSTYFSYAASMLSHRQRPTPLRAHTLTRDVYRFIRSTQIRAMFTVAETWCRQERFFFILCAVSFATGLRRASLSLVCVLFKLLTVQVGELATWVD